MTSSIQTENDVEKYLVKELNKIDVPCYKFATHRRGEPDRLAFIGSGLVCFIETKIGQNGLSIHQRKRHEEYRSRGYWVFVANTKELVDTIVLEIHKAKILLSPEIRSEA